MQFFLLEVNAILAQDQLNEIKRYYMPRNYAGIE